MGLGEVLEERDGGRRVIGEAVEEEERARVDRAADERVNLAERQRERGAGEPRHQGVVPPDIAASRRCSRVVRSDFGTRSVRHENRSLLSFSSWRSR